MRKKQITFEGAEFSISPLNLEQVDKFVVPLDAATDAGSIKIQGYELVCSGLNNANPDDPWTHERLRTEFDLPLLAFVRDEILKFSGLALASVDGDKKGETQTAGEAPAASGK